VIEDRSGSKASVLRPTLIDTLFKAAGMQRWNDRIRPVEMRELDKQAHKMITAFVLARSREDARPGGKVDWIQLIEGGFFEFLQRVVITDLKPELFERIRSDRPTYRKLRDWAFGQVRGDLESLSPELAQRCRSWFECDQESEEAGVLRAAHAYATRWEFRILRHAAPPGFDLDSLGERLEARLDETAGHIPVEIPSPGSGLARFIDLCGELRFQVRWSHLSIVPRVSVLGHMLIVALLAYLLSLQMGACSTRKVNNFLTGLFHDLPEVLTRDVIDPVKRSVKGLGEIIKDYEKREMEERVMSLLPPAWHAEIRLFTENEFESSIDSKGSRVPVSTEEIGRHYNQDRYSPRDGELVRICDHMAAFGETCRALDSGWRHPELTRAHEHIFRTHRNTRLGGLPIGRLFEAMARPRERTAE